ncbi:MAG: 6-oxopurine nucleoside phosphorylase [Deltaproteobacteria bacterium HGW-Deltaproteobacteria-10]|nr:MAG: 6-oxopurine nucleoside phosphorylase [Deltaproteobacteria bacterium HGW-Deltaproteobacteria-10]
MGILGIISGTIIMERSDLLVNYRRETVKNDFGTSLALVSDKIVLIPRHGNDPQEHILPHFINHRANLKALKDLGASEVVGINSTGSLKTHLCPGMIVIPDDFIALTATPTIYQNKAVHVTPSLDENVRQKLIGAANNCQIPVVEKGIYWQTPGPRLETKAETRMMANYADIVGMTMASEAVIALELNLPYASACSIDNFGNGIMDKPLGMDEIIAGARKNADLMIRLLQSYLKIIS